MDLKEYISSGIIELYASGNLNEHESAEVEHLIRTYPEIKSEYEKIQQTIYLTSLINIKTPSPLVKESIFKTINRSEKPFSQSKQELISSENKQSSSFKYLLAASIVFLLTSLVVNLYLYNKLNDANSEIAILSDQKKIITQEYEAVNKKLSIARSDIEILHDRNYKAIDLRGMEISPSSNVMAYWSPVTKKVFVEVRSLPVPPPDKQYQLWAISQGIPVDLGVMDVDPSDLSLHEMKNMEDPQAFAVTLEPKGGSAIPTMDQMYVMGEINI